MVVVVAGGESKGKWSNHLSLPQIWVKILLRILALGRRGKWGIFGGPDLAWQEKSLARSCRILWKRTRSATQKQWKLISKIKMKEEAEAENYDNDSQGCYGQRSGGRGWCWLTTWTRYYKSIFCPSTYNRRRWPTVTVLCNQLRSLKLRLLAKEDKECYTKAMLEAYYNKQTQKKEGGGRSQEGWWWQRGMVWMKIRPRMMLADSD